MGDRAGRDRDRLLVQRRPVEERIRDCTFLLQKEVVDRMVAAPGTPDYGRLSVMLLEPSDPRSEAPRKLFNLAARLG